MTDLTYTAETNITLQQLSSKYKSFFFKKKEKNISDLVLYRNVCELTLTPGAEQKILKWLHSHVINKTNTYRGTAGSPVHALNEFRNPGWAKALSNPICRV